MFMENKPYGESLDCEFFVTTSRPFTVNVQMKSPKFTSPSIDESFTVKAGEVKQIIVSKNFKASGTGKEGKAIHITADDDIVVYGVNKEKYSVDGYLALPVSEMGYEYRTVNMAPALVAAEIGIVGILDGTTVELTFPTGQSVSVVYNGQTYYGDDTLSVSLDRFDTFQVKTTGDLTGTLVKANKPVSVFSGNLKTKIGSGGSSDHLVEQLVPLNKWGRRFFTVPIPGRTVGDYFRIVASEDSTTVFISGESDVNLAKAGNFKQLIIGSNEYKNITSDKPIMLLQFVQSQRSSAEPADPAMILIPPIEQYGADYTFATPKYTQGSYQNNFMIIIKNDDKDGLIFDDNPIDSSSWTNVPGSNPAYVARSLDIQEGVHRIRHVATHITFCGFLYGKAPYETYGFPTGMRMGNINEVKFQKISVIYLVLNFSYNMHHSV